jgi:hypothetical protein
MTGSAADLSGHYACQNIREMAAELELKPDGTFEFGMIYGAADWWAKGKWITRDGAVILNTTTKEEPPFKLVRSSASKSSEIHVRVVTPGDRGRGVPNIDVALVTKQGKTEARTDSEGIAMFRKEDAPLKAAFLIRVYHLETELYELNSAHDDFTFEINGPGISELRFTDERLVVNGKTLVSHYWGPDQDMRFVKQ